MSILRVTCDEKIKGGKRAQRMYEVVKEQCTIRCYFVCAYNTTWYAQNFVHRQGLCEADLKGECSYYTHYVEKNHGKKVAQMKLGIPRKILRFSNKQPAGKLPTGKL